jgi:uncharacterized protein (TIGR03000 family)
MFSFRSFSFGVPALLAGVLLALTAAPSRAEPAFADSFQQVTGHSAPIFLTSINYPGVYGAYTSGVAAYAYNTRPAAPTFHPRLDTVVISEHLPRFVPPPAVADWLPEATAGVNVIVPAEASVWVQDVRMYATGMVREFVSPPLVAGQDYTYKVRASWIEDGHEVVRNQVVHVAAGKRVNVDLISPPAPAAGTTTLRAGTLP